jgi:hypothetical protein
MSLKAGVAKAEAELAAIKAALWRARLVRGEMVLRIVNDPEEGLDAFRGGDDDLSKTIEISGGPATWPGKPTMPD